MSRSSELFMQTREMEAQVDDSDYQYFEWLTDKQWQEYLDEKENEYHRKFGHALVFRMEWNKFLIKNHM